MTNELDLVSVVRFDRRKYRICSRRELELFLKEKNSDVGLAPVFNLIF